MLDGIENQMYVFAFFASMRNPPAIKWSKTGVPHINQCANILVHNRGNRLHPWYKALAPACKEMVLKRGFLIPINEQLTNSHFRARHKIIKKREKTPAPSISMRIWTLSA